MPTYDYQCRSCGAITEVIHAMSEDGPTVCERCGGDLRRVLYPAGIIFKGSGFYRTDSRTEKAKGDGGSSPTSTASTPKPSTSGTTTSGEASSGGSTAGGDAAA